LVKDGATKVLQEKKKKKMRSQGLQGIPFLKPNPPLPLALSQDYRLKWGKGVSPRRRSTASSRVIPLVTFIKTFQKEKNPAAQRGWFKSLSTPYPSFTPATPASNLQPPVSSCNSILHPATLQPPSIHQAAAPPRHHHHHPPNESPCCPCPSPIALQRPQHGAVLSAANSLKRPAAQLCRHHLQQHLRGRQLHPGSEPWSS